MFIDIAEHHAALVTQDMIWAAAEHHGYLQALLALDMRDEAQALAAIRRWLLPGSEDWSPAGRFLRREACRFQLMRGHGFGRCWLPGLSDLPDTPEGNRAFAQGLDVFQRLVWRELFPEEPYQPRAAARYRHRVDIGFRCAPDLPETWGPARYQPW